jgi:hypothetical protein
VFFEGEGEGVSFLPRELLGTGEFEDRAPFYDDDIVKVRVDGEEGSLSD